MFNGAVDDLLPAVQPTVGASLGLVFLAVAMILVGVVPTKRRRPRSASTRSSPTSVQPGPGPAASLLEPVGTMPSVEGTTESRYRRRVLIVFAGVLLLALFQRGRRR